jgi:hypothetical protein
LIFFSFSYVLLQNPKTPLHSKIKINNRIYLVSKYKSYILFVINVICDFILMNRLLFQWDPCRLDLTEFLNASRSTVFCSNLSRVAYSGTLPGPIRDAIDWTRVVLLEFSFKSFHCKRWMHPYYHFLSSLATISIDPLHTFKGLPFHILPFIINV